MTAYVYILANRPRGVLYVGVTSDLVKRVYEHKQHFVPGFAARYNIEQLVWFESGESIVAAIEREKQLKKWNRAWKIELIEATNPEWKDLYSSICS